MLNFLRVSKFSLIKIHFLASFFLRVVLLPRRDPLKGRVELKEGAVGNTDCLKYGSRRAEQEGIKIDKGHEGGGLDT